jgi:hypothetical protein
MNKQKKNAGTMQQEKKPKLLFPIHPSTHPRYQRNPDHPQHHRSQQKKNKAKRQSWGHEREIIRGRKENYQYRKK